MAVHESGHALVAAISEHGDPVAKVTILPAGQALGVTERGGLIDERHLYTEGYLKDSWRSGWGGWPSSWCSARTPTGAANDLAGATDLATRMVRSSA